MIWKSPCVIISDKNQPYIGHWHKTDIDKQQHFGHQWRCNQDINLHEYWTAKRRFWDAWAQEKAHNSFWNRCLVAVTFTWKQHNRDVEATDHRHRLDSHSSAWSGCLLALSFRTRIGFKSDVDIGPTSNSSRLDIGVDVNIIQNCMYIGQQNDAIGMSGNSTQISDFNEVDVYRLSFVH